MRQHPMSAARCILGWTAWTTARALVRVGARVLGATPLGIVAGDLGASMRRVPSSISRAASLPYTVVTTKSSQAGR